MIKIKNYTIKSKLKQSSLATVYLAKNRIAENDIEGDIALKVIQTDITTSDTLRKKFLVIAHRIAQLKHPCIVKTYDININDDNICYMTMEYLEKGSLSKKMQQTPLSITLILKIMKRIGSALSYLHRQDFVHGHIKPDNILFANNDEAKLANSGLAELQDVSGSLALQNSLHYMSPEQATMTKLDKRSDIYSLGLVLYEMLVVEKVFSANTMAEAIYQHTMVPPPNLPDEYHYFQPVLDKALAKKPNNRFTTIEEMIHALKAAVDTYNINENETENHVDIYDGKPAHTSHSLMQQKPKVHEKSKLIKAVISSILALLILIVLVFTKTITLDSFHNKSLNLEQISTIQETPINLPLQATLLTKQDTNNKQR